METEMHIIEAIKLYCHLMQQSGGGLSGREISREALTKHHVNKEVIDSISDSVSNDGHLCGEDGARYAITLVANS